MTRLGKGKIKASVVGRGVFVAASAVAAAASAWEMEHRRVRRADLTESELRIEKLSDLRYDKQALQAIENGLQEEWGEFAFLGFKNLREMLAKAGDTIFVVMERDSANARALGVVQTILTDVHGDAALLQETYPDFAALTSRESWARSRRKGGDTVVMLQITTLGKTERGGGTGSLLRNAALSMLDERVAYALTTTPVDGTPVEDIDVELPKTYSAAMRFHARGGANPARILPGYKTPSGAAPGSHGADVVVMRYARDESGRWPAPRPSMRLRSMGPLQRQVTQALRRLRLRRLSRVRPGRPSFRQLRGTGRRIWAKRPSARMLADLRTRVARRRHQPDDSTAPAA